MPARLRPPFAGTDEVLDSWKAIAAYLNREVRTVMRWERGRRLPVHRLPGGGKAGVYALKSELDAWWRDARTRSLELNDSPGPAASESGPAVAILPFANLTGKAEDEYLGDGLAEDIIAALTLVPGLRVAARTSAFAFRKERDLREVGAALNVDAILEGSVQKAGDRVRVTARFVKTSDGYEIWSQHFDCIMTDVFAVQDEISHAVVEKLRVRLVNAQPLVREYTDKPEAYEMLLRGRQSAYCQTPESLEQARQFLEQAVLIDPRLALAHVGLAEYHFCTGLWGSVPSGEAIRHTKQSALLALDRDSSLAEAHAVLGIALGTGEFNWAEAEREFHRALELCPSSPAIHSHYASFLLRPTGRLDEACREAARAVQLDPYSPTMHHTLGYLYYATGQDGAAAHLTKAAELEPSMWIPHFMLALVCLRAGQPDRAVQEAQLALQLSSRSAMALGMLAVTYALGNRQPEALELLQELRTRRQATHVPPWAIAAPLRALGHMDEMFDWLERGVEQRDLPIVCGLKAEPAYAPLRADSRFQLLLRRMNLER